MADHCAMNTCGIRIIYILNFIEGELAPTARIDPRQLVVDEGEAVEFHCMVTGNPLPRINWSYGDDGILPIDAVVENDVLRFQSVTRHHAGEYVCHASNSVGSGQALVRLDVNYGLSIIFIIRDFLWFSSCNR